MLLDRSTVTRKSSHEIIVPTPNKRLRERKFYIPDGENTSVIWCDISLSDIKVYVCSRMYKEACLNGSLKL